MKNKYIGKDYPISDSLLKVTGEQKYTCDFNFPNMYYAKIMFSESAHGRIKKMNISKALEVKGVIKIFTPFNTTNKLFNSYINYINQNSPLDERLFTDTPLFVGDRIAAVVAVSKQIAEECLRLIEVEYEDYPTLVDVEIAIKENATKIHSNGNILSECEHNVGNAGEMIKDSSITFKDHIFTQRVHHAAMENHCCIVESNSLNEITVWSSCQSVYAIRNTIGEFLGIPYNNIRVIKNTMGGSFGGKQHVILELITAYLAKEVNGTVKLEYSRTNAILSTVVGTSMDFEIESALSAEGNIIASKINAILDAGAYTSNSADMGISTGKKLFRTYKIPNINYKSKSVFTNTPTSGGFRGWGCPQINTALELHLNNIAKKMNIDPVKFRMDNLVDPYDMELLTRITLGNANVKECLREGEKEFNWVARYNKNDKTGRYRRGAGVACGGHVNGYYGKVQDFASMILKMNEDGSFILNTAVHDQGCGTLLSMALIIAEVLDTDLKYIKVLEADTDRSPYDMGTFSSRVTYVCGRCAKNVAEKVKQKIINTAAIILNKKPSYLYIENACVYVDGDRNTNISYKDLASTAQVKYEIEIIDTETYSSVSNPGAYGVHFSEVEVDTYTGMVQVLDYLAVHDVGKAINRCMVEGQIQGGVQMGIGYALTEEIKIDKNGFPKTNNFKDYIVINTPDMPTVRTKILECGGDEGPFGAKSIGEVAIVPVIAAIANAVNDALGTNMTSFPLTPEKIVAEINKNKEGE